MLAECYTNEYKNVPEKKTKRQERGLCDVLTQLSLWILMRPDSQSQVLKVSIIQKRVSHE